MNDKQKRFPLFHVPHDGGLFPAELMASVCVPKERFLYYHERMRDTGALQMVPAAWRNGENTLYFPVSRLLCDVERFPGPEEPMERLGMGFCYERAFDGTRIKAVTEDLKQKTLAYYRGHHERLDRICAAHPRILLLDMHSFSDEIVPRDQLRAGRDTPDVCIGVDEKYTPPELVSLAESVLRKAGFSTARNYPYSGSLVPNAVLSGRSGCGCVSVMLEWNKRAYCGGNGLPVEQRLALIRKTIGRIVALAQALP